MKLGYRIELYARIYVHPDKIFMSSCVDRVEFHVVRAMRDQYSAGAYRTIQFHLEVINFFAALVKTRLSRIVMIYRVFLIKGHNESIVKVGPKELGATIGV